MDKIKKVDKKSREEKFFKDTPVWKSLLIMSIPSMIMMLVFGMYTFIDNVLSINFANDSYSTVSAGFSGKDQVRLFMSGVTPITTFMFAVAMLFGVGLSRRVSINIGAKKEDRALRTMKTAMQFALGLSVILMPILFFAAKPWMKSQFDGNAQMSQLIADEGYKYVWIIIMAFPIQIFTQIMSSLYRTEARNKIVLLATVAPLSLNLLFDYIFMGPLGMGINGGAWATFISYVVTALIFIYFMLTVKSSRFSFRNLFGKKGFQWITIVGVILVGIAPFMRNMAQSITQTVEMRQIQNVSEHIYGDNMKMSIIMSAVFPIFGLFFPMMFGFIQAGSPITGYNYGAGNMKKVKQTTIYIVIYSTIVATLIFVVSTWGLMRPLTNLLGIEDSNIQISYKSGTNPPSYSSQLGTILETKVNPITGDTIVKYDSIFNTLDKSQKMYGIMMSSALFFGPSLGAMSLFGSTDRVFLNIFASSLRGLILLIPILFIFANIAVDHPGDIGENLVGTNGIFTDEFLFWWFYPFLAFVTSLILITLAIFTMRRLDKKHKPLEERIEAIHDWNKKRIEKRKN
ncbi:MAG: hypothetical protein HRT99_02060 [Mycoplasmatales bacterium]|nr:hypothetical protein [Mycoplasmatales bacterium]